MSSRALDVLVVARPGDQHADAVLGLLKDAGASAGRASANALQNDRIRWSPEPDVRLVAEGSELVVDAATCIWWRRPGWFETSVEDHAEVVLLEAEVAQILEGALLSLEPRWVDSPMAIRKAENKLVQLTLAKRLGVRTPDSIVTNEPRVAAEFLEAGAVVAKSVSSGPGLAPYVGPIDPSLLDAVATAPVLLQRLVEADADCRVVTVDDDVFCWTRSRGDLELPDWRHADPPGSGFELQSEVDPALGRDALQLAACLGLSVTVQDWLVDSSSHHFLEVNPQGQWLFLDQALEVVAPRFARHLVGKRA